MELHMNISRMYERHSSSLSVSRMKDTSKKNNIFSQFRKNDRDKQKLIETVVKQLRSLVNGMSSWTHTPGMHVCVRDSHKDIFTHVNNSAAEGTSKGTA